jgi:LPS export ABC transporter protein LptC
MILQKWAWIPLLLIGLMLTACEEIEEEKPWLQVERPEMLFTDTTLMDSYDKGVLAWKLKTAYLERWGDKEIVFVRPVLVDIYDSLGERTAFLRADSGRMDLKFTYVYAYGHVYALTPKGASVRSDSLIWNKKDNLVKTDSYVRVVSEEGDVLQGQGFVSDAHMDNWRILSNVTGIFQDAARRLKEEDKTQAKEIESRDSAQAVRSSSSVAAKVATPVAKSSSATASKPAKATPDAPATKQDSLAEKARRNALNAIRGTVLRPKAKTRNE